MSITLIRTRRSEGEPRVGIRDGQRSRFWRESASKM